MLRLQHADTLSGIANDRRHGGPPALSPKAFRINFSSLIVLLYLIFSSTNALASEEWFSFYSHGNRLLTSGQYAEAIKYLDKAIGLDPTALEAYHCKGMALSKLGKYEAAVGVFNEILRRNPLNSPAYCNRGFCYMQQGRLDEALTDLNRCLDASPALNNALCNRAEVFLRKGELQKAIADSSNAIAADDLDADPFITRGDAFARQGLIKEALADYTSAIDIHPDPVNMFHPEGYSYYQRAKLLEQEGKKSLASKDREAARMFGYSDQPKVGENKDSATR